MSVSVESVFHRSRPGLLVSVRSADEALAALEGGADVIDVKEPRRGSLGPADWETIRQIERTVDGRAPVTAAAGELVDLLSKLESGAIQAMPSHVSLVKIGLSGCRRMPDWTAAWRRAIDALCATNSLSSATLPAAAVVYADWQAADTPAPDEICSAAVDIRCQTVLVDTWDKQSGHLFDHWPENQLQLFVERTRARGFAVALAGSLAGNNVLRAAGLGPDLIAVRGAACETGRAGTVARRLVEHLRCDLANLSLTSNSRHASATVQPRTVRSRPEEEFS